MIASHHCIDVPIRAWGLLEGTSTCKSPFVPLHFSGLSPTVVPHLGLNLVTLLNLLSSDNFGVGVALARTRHVFDVSAPSFDSEDL